MASGQPPGTDPLQPWAKTNASVNVERGSIEQERNDIKNTERSDDFRRAPMMVYTEEERAVLKECERESFYLRALPFSVGCMVGVQTLAKSGRLVLHPKFGSIPKTIIGGAFGYFLGKISYMSQCQQKVLEKIPNSNLAVAIRKSRGIKEEASKEESWEHAPSYKLRDEYNSMDNPTRDEAPSSSALDLDERSRPLMDRESESSKGPQEKPFTSYEDLRRRNRNQSEGQAVPSPQTPGSPNYEDRLRGKSKSQPTNPGFDDTPSNSISHDPPKRRRTNVWGDPIDD